MRTLALILWLVTATLCADLLVIDIGYLKPGYVLLVDGEEVREAKLLKVGSQPKLPTPGSLEEKLGELTKDAKPEAVKALAQVYKKVGEEVKAGTTKPADALDRVKSETDKVLLPLNEPLSDVRKLLSDEFSKRLVAGNLSTKEQVSAALREVSDALSN